MFTKKIFLPLLLLLAPLALSAQTIYTGSTEISWSSTVTISADKFTTLNVADQIVFNITYVGGDDWPQVALFDGWWQSLPGAGNTLINASTTQVIYYATTAMITALQERGMVVSGIGYILDSIEIVASESDDDMSAAVWIGNAVFDDSWNDSVALPASCFTDAEVGDYLRFHYKDLGAGAYFSVLNGSWQDLVDAAPGTPEGSYTRYEITEAMLAEIQLDGVIVHGLNFTLTYVDIANPLDTPALTGSVPITNNWVFENGTNPYIEVRVTNGTEQDVNANVELLITTDKYETVTTLTETAEVAVGKVVTVPFEFSLDPGFYRITAMVNEELARAFVIGVDPEKVVSPPDAQDDFSTFWQTAKDELATVEINPTFTRMDSKCTSNRDVYLVEFYSIPDVAGGEPVVIRAYYAEPVAEGKYPTVIHYQGYDGGTYDPYCMGGNDLPGYCELSLSTRGQLINNRDPYVNTYGDWFQYNFGYKDIYYYHGAYMDVLRAIDFVCSRDKVDKDNLFAEGQSQGGAFTYAAAALTNNHLAAVAPAIPFMGDFPDYFELASWPGNVAREKQKELGMNDEEMFAFLSYFDTKNLAPYITDTPVIETVGLVDTTCPPHTNLAPYNNLPDTVEKQISYNPLLGHEVPSSWTNTYMAFFEQHMTTSGITSVTAATAHDTAAYNLAGQRVGASYKGIVVADGKKYVVK